MLENHKEFKTLVGGREVTVDVGKYAQQANGSCIVKCGETMVMVNVTMAAEPRAGMDFFPLSVDYEEKMYSVGKIPGGFKKREGRASDKAILVSRLIDRPIRPLFPKGLFNDVTVVATALSVDPDIAPEPLAMLGSSIALSISDIPWAGPTGSVVVGIVDGEYVINPTVAQKEKSTLALNLSGTKDAIMMVEAGAKEIDDEAMVGAILSVTKKSKSNARSSKVSLPNAVRRNSKWNFITFPKISTRQFALTRAKNSITLSTRSTEWKDKIVRMKLKKTVSNISRSSSPIWREKSRIRFTI